jgi:spermidine/putrescine transport system permease protein
VNAAAGRLGRWGLSGYFVLLALFLYAPLAVLIVFSFDNSTIASLPYSGFTTRWYHDAFNNPNLTDSLILSAKIAAGNAVLASVLGLLAAMGLSATHLRLRGAITAVLMLPLVVPYIVLAIGMLILLNQLGLGQSTSAVLAGHIVVTVPYTILVILPRLRTLDASLTEAARDLGANNVAAFVRITLPLITPAMVSSFLIAFTISFDEYAIASFLIPPGVQTFPVFLYGGTKTPLLRPQLIAVGAIVIAISLALVVLTEVGRQVWERRLEGQTAGA